MYNLFMLIIESLFFIFPAYLANAAPVISNGSTPIDMGKKLSDGKRILGDGKTLQGFILGLFLGVGVGILQGRFIIGLTLALGALLGDLFGSFIKRRIGFSRGDPFILLDQLDFILGAILLIGAFSSINLINTPRLEILITIIIITPPIHLITNYISYKIGLKSRPY